MATLYELTGELLRLAELAEDPGADPQAIADTMEALGGELEDKADGYARVMRQLAADMAGIDAEVKRLQERRAAIQANSDRMRQRLQAAMEAAGKPKFRTALFSFGIRRNPPKVVIDSDVPEGYLIPQPPKVDTAGIREALKAGKDLKFAHLEQGSSLRIE